MNSQHEIPKTGVQIIYKPTLNVNLKDINLYNKTYHTDALHVLVGEL